MLMDEVPAEASGQENIEIAFRPPVVGRVLCERFLVEEDLSDPWLVGRYTSHRIKDLKGFCRQAVLNIVNFTPVIEARPSFQQVCEALLQVSHPNIEKVIETGLLFDGRTYSLTDEPKGDRLDSLIHNGRRLDLGEAALVIEQVADGLSAAHLNGILHCDLRPSNLIVSSEARRFDRIKIINFGMAWPIDVRGDGFVNLSPESECFPYAAPETYSILGHRSSASDVFSLAVIAYRLITGRLPFNGSNAHELLDATNRGEWVPPTELRTDLTFESEAILRTGLQFEPAWRPQSIDDFAYRLVSSLRPAPIVATMAIYRETTAEPFETLPVIEVNEATPEHPVPVDEQMFVRAPRRIPAIISDRAVAWTLIILLLAGALSIPIGQTLLKEEKAEAAVETMLDRTQEDHSKRQLRFWIESRSSERRVPISEAASLPLADTIMSLVSDSTGAIYVIRESSDSDGRTAYKLLFPQAGGEPVTAGKAVRTTPIGVHNDTVWIVWTADRSQDLESNLYGATSDKPNEEAARKLRHFLERNRNHRLEVGVDDRGVETLLNGIGDRIVYRVALPDA
jgi:hypothetical protein